MMNVIASGKSWRVFDLVANFFFSFFGNILKRSHSWDNTVASERNDEAIYPLLN